MEQIPIRTLNQDTAGVLARVERGEAVEITNRGRPIARIVPVDADPLSDLVAAGVVLPPTITGPLTPPAVAAAPGQPEAGELITALRDEERW
jgi:prevent-host-death family protein